MKSLPKGWKFGAVIWAVSAPLFIWFLLTGIYGVLPPDRILIVIFWGYFFFVVLPVGLFYKWLDKKTERN
jgi:hypothetical protein